MLLPVGTFLVIDTDCRKAAFQQTVRTYLASILAFWQSPLPQLLLTIVLYGAPWTHWSNPTWASPFDDWQDPVVVPAKWSPTFFWDIDIQKGIFALKREGDTLILSGSTEIHLGQPSNLDLHWSWAFGSDAHLTFRLLFCSEPLLPLLKLVKLDYFSRFPCVLLIVPRP